MFSIGCSVSSLVFLKFPEFPPGQIQSTVRRGSGAECYLDFCRSLGQFNVVGSNAALDWLQVSMPHCFLILVLTCISVLIVWQTCRQLILLVPTSLQVLIGVSWKHMVNLNRFACMLFYLTLLAPRQFTTSTIRQVHSASRGMQWTTQTRC
ncbi:hypothetical protein QBC46DRAFT_36379 [Diplogelasinospora grovesii]|uniref:Uncharacterized protein n=1 Tax=Diplogelasinospora grovesii TaxID=303347 RepID=A0AAN6N2F3_9PEZI|nr:hypothetical protein QBC46DRAFT_36379 [Diplogelasinospora grovesii]